MEAIQFSDFLAGANGFLMHFVSALALTGLFAFCYVWITPYAEFKLIREGKTAPALAFGGAVLGFVLALSAAIANSVSYWDMLLWALMALIVQVSLFWSVAAAFADLCRRIAEDELGSAILLAALSLAVGILNAACMSY